MRLARIDVSNPIPIIGDGAIANTDVADGRLIPVLVTDCDNRRDIVDLVLTHRDTPPGDVVVRWVRKVFNEKVIYLFLSFERPMEVSFQFTFDIQEQGGLVDMIVRARAFYLQPKDFGMRASEGLNRPKILIEVPSSTKLPGWDETYRRSITKRYRKQGMTKIDAATATVEHLARLRELTGFRKNGSHQNSNDPQRSHQGNALD